MSRSGVGAAGFVGERNRVLENEWNRLRCESGIGPAATEDQCAATERD